jgi:REP element-mobilizing transposase RayT
MKQYNPDIHHRRSVRLGEYDYSWEGFYFVTICTHEQRMLFGKVVDGEIQLKTFGHIAKKEWLATTKHRPYVIMHEFVFMPNHLHGIVEIIRRGVACNAQTHNAQTCNAEMHNAQMNNICEKKGVARNVPTGIAPKSGTLSTIIRAYKSAVSKSIHEINSVIVWQRNYYEHIIRNNADYNRIIEYMTHNPAEWQKDRFYNEEKLFNDNL